MTLEEAIKTAIEFEENVRDVYFHARDNAVNDVGKRVFKVLADEEQRHVDYLNHKLEQLEETGRVDSEDLETAIPSPEKISEGVKNLENRLPSNDRDTETDMLKKALQVEVEASNFYKKMVDEMDTEGRNFFCRFMEIEQGHVAIVQAELDSVMGNGFWFDMPEFRLEAG
jgi:rubrerythrin